MVFFGHAPPWKSHDPKGYRQMRLGHITHGGLQKGQMESMQSSFEGAVADTKGQVRCSPMQAEAAQSRRRAHAPANDGLLSDCRLRQGWIGCDTSFSAESAGAEDICVTARMHAWQAR